MSSINNKQVLDALKNITILGHGTTVTECVDDIKIAQDEITVVLAFDSIKETKYLEDKGFTKECESELTRTFPSHKIRVIMICHTNGKATKKDLYSKSVPKAKYKVGGVKKIIMVASGKGGVGKSTIAFNLALALAERGYKIGLLDVDIYGPSVAKMSGITGQPTLTVTKKMVPHEKFGLQLMSIGYLVKEYAATIWRGPMVTKMLYQLLSLTDWAYNAGELDYLILDTPPGTGDVHLSLAENYNVDGAIIISTPQEIALIDAKKAINMCNKLSIPVLGLIENMGYYSSKNGEKILIFGESHVTPYVQRAKIDFLGEIPIDTNLTISADNALPILHQDPDHYLTQLFTNIALRSIGKMNSLA